MRHSSQIEKRIQERIIQSVYKVDLKAVFGISIHHNTT